MRRICISYSLVSSESVNIHGITEFPSLIISQRNKNNNESITFATSDENTLGKEISPASFAHTVLQ